MPSKSAKTRNSSIKKLAELDSLGRYKIRRLVGSGGMGMVFKAHDGELQRTVALKVLPKDKAENPVLIKRFKAEAKASAHLNHPNIVRVYDHGEIDGYLYIAMEYISGVDVHELMERQGGPLTPKRSMDITRQVALALQHAFERNIVHRDIKPSNLMIDKDGNVKLTDMGLARSLSDTSTTALTQAGSTVGTVDYMSPEQARDSKAADTRSDIYSLGATWYHMVVGKPPFPNGDMLNKIHAHCTKEVPDPRETDPDIPDAIVDMLHRMLEKEPENRYQTPQDLLDDIEGANLEKREISMGLLASLAEEDNAAPSSTRSSSGKKSSQRPTAKSRKNSSDRSDTPRRSSKSSRSEKPAAARSSKAKSKRRKSDRSRVKASTQNDDDTPNLAALASEDENIPSAREMLMNRPTLRRGQSKPKRKLNVSLDTGRLTAIVVGVAALLIVGGLVIAEIKSSGSETPDNASNVVPVNQEPIVIEPIPGVEPNTSQPKR